MQGKHVAITGATSGIGRASAMELARRGAELTLLNRNADTAQALGAEIERETGARPRLIQMNMASLADVRRAAESLLTIDRPLDVLLNNAGVVNTQRRVTVDGFEETLAVNHLAPFLLTGLLLPLLQKAPAARVVNVSSGAHAFARDMRFDDMQAERKYSTFGEYGRSKLANILFTRELAARFAPTNMTTNSLHPGAVSTSLGKQNDGLLGKMLPALLKPFFLTPEQGAETSIYLCSSEDVATTSGAYFVKCREKQPKPQAVDEEAARRLWSFSEQAVDWAYPDLTG